MRIRRRRRREFSTNNAAGIDCVDFIQMAAGMRWREVEGFFPVDPDAEALTEREQRLLPRINPLFFRCHGTCGLPPDEALMAYEGPSPDRLTGVDAVAYHMGITRKQAVAFLESLRVWEQRRENEKMQNRDRLLRLHELREKERQRMLKERQQESEAFVEIEPKAEFRFDPELAEAMRREAGEANQC